MHKFLDIHCCEGKNKGNVSKLDITIFSQSDICGKLENIITELLHSIMTR